MLALDRWLHYILQSHDHDAVGGLLHPDVVFESPVVHTPQRGRDPVSKYLVSADKVLGGPNFKYVRQWRSDDSAVLEFDTEIDGIRVHGVDIISFNDDGTLITEFTVMIRPLKAINLVHRLMGEQLMKA